MCVFVVLAVRASLCFSARRPCTRNRDSKCGSTGRTKRHTREAPTTSCGTYIFDRVLPGGKFVCYYNMTLRICSFVCFEYKQTLVRTFVITVCVCLWVCCLCHILACVTVCVWICLARISCVIRVFLCTLTCDFDRGIKYIVTGCYREVVH